MTENSASPTTAQARLTQQHQSVDIPQGYSIQFKRMGDLQEGDTLVGPDAVPTSIKQVYEKHIPERMYRITFSNGLVVEASGNHLWYVTTPLDHESYRARCRQSRQYLLRKFRPWTISLLETMAEESTGEVMDIVAHFNELLTLLDIDHDDERGVHIVERVCRSVGPIEETHVTNVDIFDEDEPTSEVKKGYDGVMVARQLLSLYGLKPYKKKYPPLAGVVVDTNTLFQMRYETPLIPARTLTQ